MGMAKAEQGTVTWGLPRVPPGGAQPWQGWREHAMAGAGPNGPRTGWGETRGEDTKARGFFHGPDGTED